MRSLLALSLLALVGCPGGTKYPPPVTDPSPSVYVDSLPPGNAKTRDVVHKTFGAFDNSGRYGSLTGGLNVNLIEDDQWGRVANFEISVEQGKVRAYYTDGKGYRYVEATPGKPARARGEVLYMGGWLSFRLQAVDGEAIGARYHAWRSR